MQTLRDASRTRKAAVVADIARSLVEPLGKRPEHIHSVIEAIADEDWGCAGLLTDGWKRAQGG